MGKSNGHIVIVDDNPSDVKLITIVLRDMGLTNTIIHLHDGEEALKYFFDKYSGEMNIDKTGLIFLDIQMRRVGGIDVLRKLKSNPPTKEIPVLMFSSSCQNGEIEECYAIGANSFVVKPTDLKMFESILRNVCSYWLGTDLPSNLN
jgi:two-component system, response regulator